MTSIIQDSKPKVISVVQAGKLFGMSRAKAYQAAHDGELPTVKIGSRLYVPVVAIDRLFADACERAAKRTAQKVAA